MRVITLGVGVLVFSALVTLSSSTAYADTEQHVQSTIENESDDFSSDILSLEKQSKLTFEEWLELHEQAEREETEEDKVVPEPVEYTVQAGDSLIKIAEKYDIDWTRIWDKNEDLEHPDELAIDDVLTIPFEEEELEERELPEAVVISPAPSEDVTTNQSSAPAPATTVQSEPVAIRGSSTGNAYTAGYCTYYVKSRRNDLPNNLGNANTWVSQASAQGYSTGRTPRVGAVAYQPASSLGHVAYVEAVHADGTVTVSEMNWRGWNTLSQRRVAASTFTYIYSK